MGTIADNIGKIKRVIPERVTLVAVSKNRPPSDIREAFLAGQCCFGENKARELTTKFPLLPTGIQWHFIGHLQSNKVKLIAPFVSLIHSVDSWKLLQVINREARTNNRVIPCLLQFHIAEEETKFGFSPEEATEILLHPDLPELENIRLDGVMGMATFTGDDEQVRKEFRHLKEIFTRMKDRYFPGEEHFREISMGMSSDYGIAIEEGSTMIRIGSAIFGS